MLRIALLLCLTVPTAAAQASPPAEPTPAGADSLARGGGVLVRKDSSTTAEAPVRASLDERAFRAVYGIESPAFGASMQGFEASWVPVVVGTGPVWLAATAATGADVRPALRLGASQVGAYAVTYGLKGGVRRSRPYAVVPGVETRRRTGRSVNPSSSFPSAHATLAFATAVSASLSEPRALVVAPTLVWATGTSLARVWHGVHYPADVLAGAAIGTGAAVLVHALLPDREGAPTDASVLSLRIGL